MKDAQKLRKEGFQQGKDIFLHDAGLICVKHRIVGPVPFKNCGYEREPGSDDETSAD